jgi:uncharacterized protein (TIGR02145 family)
MENLMCKILFKILLITLTVQILFAQDRDMVITKENGSIDYVPISGIDNITFIESGTTGTMSDIDGNVYKTVKIGNQWWMAENLKVTNFNTGRSIFYATDSTEWYDYHLPYYCAYNFRKANADTFGYLYNWYAAIHPNLAPEGWHVPTDEEWKELFEFLIDKSNNDSLALTEDETNYSDHYGFTCLPGGICTRNSRFFSLGKYGHFWSSSLSDTNYLFRNVSSHSTNENKGSNIKKAGLSIRCVKD